jgi:hypothetical protein
MPNRILSYILALAIVLAVALALFSFTYRSISTFLTERAPHHSSTDIDRLEKRLSELQEKLDTVSATTSPQTSDIQQLEKELGEISERFRVLSLESAQKDALMVANERFTSQGLTLATIWVGVVAIAFTIFVALLGFDSFRRTGELRASIEKGKKEYEVHLAKYQSLKDEADSMKNFAQNLTDKFFSEALLELLRELQKANALTSEADRTLRTKTMEVKSRILLHHPDFNRVNAAIQTLEGLGSRDALQDLSELIGNDKAPAKTREAAARAIDQISARDALNSKSSSTTPSPPDDPTPSPTSHNPKQSPPTDEAE